MGHSISWVMEYYRRAAGTLDRVGGLPRHLPHVWPRRQLCQGRMGFVGQLYCGDRLPLSGHLAAQFYVCDDCRETFDQANDRVPIHLELLPPTAEVNTSRTGVRCPSQPLRYIAYTPVQDSMDQWAFDRRKPAEGDLRDKHLRRDKVGGLFPYDGYEGPPITRQNRMIAQFLWQGIGGPIYLFSSDREGIYPYHYR
jgi:hypothetical protein